MTESWVELADSPLRPGAGATKIYYRETGSGIPLIFLHGGWGYEVYPFDNQISALQGSYRILIPDRSGYGQSSSAPEQPVDFHSRAASETLSFLDALRIDRAILWGHSDGAVIAALCGLAAPQRVIGLILEAIHFQRAKHRSHDWMRSVLRDPDLIGERARTALMRDHGEGWRGVVERNAAAWLAIAQEPGKDLYGGRLAELKPPTLIIFGENDQRTEPGDLDGLREALPGANFQTIPGAGHSPHSGSASAADCTRIAEKFLGGLTV